MVNLRLRMRSAGDPWHPTTAQPIPGDGAQALYAERPVWFDGRFLPARLYRRDALRPGDSFPGPALITEYTAATVLPPGASLAVDAFSNLVLTVDTEARP